MKINVAFQSKEHQVLLRFTAYSDGLASEIWLKPAELAELCQDLFKFKDARCIIESDRVRILHNGEAAPAAATYNPKELANVLREIRSLKTEISGILRTGSQVLPSHLADFAAGLHNIGARLATWSTAAATAAQLATAAPATQEAVKACLALRDKFNQQEIRSAVWDGGSQAMNVIDIALHTVKRALQAIEETTGEPV